MPWAEGWDEDAEEAENSLTIVVSELRARGIKTVGPFIGLLHRWRDRVDAESHAKYIAFADSRDPLE